MRQLLYTLLILFFFSSFNGCTNYQKDGRYYAEVSYFYPKTGTRSTYLLEVEVLDNKLTKIYWTNGGQLNNTHFTSPDIIEKEASFTSYRGVEYKVVILNGQNYYLSNNSIAENEFITQENARFCPRCGQNKEIRNSYCNSCAQELSCVYVYGRVDFLTYRTDGQYIIKFINGNKIIDKKGVACSNVFKINRSRITNFKQQFYSCTDVQYFRNNDGQSTFVTYPETVDVSVFETMEEATESLMKNNDRSLSNFRYSDAL